MAIKIENLTEINSRQFVNLTEISRDIIEIKNLSTECYEELSVGEIESVVGGINVYSESPYSSKEIRLLCHW